MSPRFRVYTNEDLVGVELGGALKNVLAQLPLNHLGHGQGGIPLDALGRADHHGENVLALCCGVSDGMGLGDNTKALLMTRGMTEMARLGVALAVCCGA